MRAAIVGAGAFGASAALELALRGHHVTVLIPVRSRTRRLVRTDYGHGFKFAPVLGGMIATPDLTPASHDSTLP